MAKKQKIVRVIKIHVCFGWRLQRLTGFLTQGCSEEMGRQGKKKILNLFYIKRGSQCHHPCLASIERQHSHGFLCTTSLMFVLVAISKASFYSLHVHLK